MHIVHIKKGIKDMVEASKIRDSLLVLGVFLEVDPSLSSDEEPFYKILEAAPKYQAS